MSHTVLFVLCLITICGCNRLGDVVPMLKRVQYDGKRTEWSDIDFSQTPRFGIKKTTTIKGAKDLLKIFNDGKYIESETDVKVSFSFHHPQFITPWITLFSEKTNGYKPVQHYLTEIDFTFIYTGDTITEVKYHTHYTDDEQLENNKATERHAPSHITINYHWHEEYEKDAFTSLTFLYVISLSCAVYIMYSIIIEASKSVQY
ncbi:DNA mismatch repair protein MutL [Acrasis kona]|uniref:DNA mismatch repair protein MutL n=1 Tax=Acrasis kona TaxID=1008807 RepID=A0AAW2ZLY3_9EUKA